MAEQAPKIVPPKEAKEADPDSFNVNQAWPASVPHPATVPPEQPPQPPQQPEQK